MMRAWRGKVCNLIAREVVIVDGANRQIRKYAPAKLDCIIHYGVEYLGLLNGEIELTSDQVYGIQGMPALSRNQEGFIEVYYIVTTEIVRAAKQAYRPLGDLLIPHRRVAIKLPRAADDAIICQGLMPAYCWLDQRAYVDS